MAMGLNTRRGKRQPMAEINITPMVDVMLVLLIIFMVTAPLLVTGVPIDLPDSKAKALAADEKPIQISVDASGTVFIDSLKIPAAALPAKLAALREARRDDPRVYVRADQRLPYGDVMALVGEISAGGFKKVALISDQHRAGPAATPAPDEAAPPAP
jgi:biopolymer transport protein TolR